MRHPFFLVVGAIGLLIAVPVLSLAGTEQSASQFQEFDASVGSTGQVKNNSSSVNDTNAQALPPASAASTVGDRQTASTPKVARSSNGAKKASQERGLTLRAIISYLTPSQAELDSALQDVISPGDRANGRPGPHWKMRPKW